MTWREHWRAIFGLRVHRATQAEVDAALGLLFFAVTVGTVLLEDGANLRLVVRLTRRTQSRGGGEERAQQDERGAEGKGHGSEGLGGIGFRQAHAPQVTAIKPLF